MASHPDVPEALASGLKRTLQAFWPGASFRALQMEACAATLQGRDCLLILPTGPFQLLPLYHLHCPPAAAYAALPQFNQHLTKTGGGKSLTYQLPPAYREQIAVVVTPLLALSSDQAAAANERGLDAASWDSRASPQQLAAIARELQSSPEDCTLRLLYTTPESLATPALR